jgi:hypothetical protein
MSGGMPGGQQAIPENGLGGSGNPLLSGSSPAPATANSMGPAQEDVFALLKNNLLRRFKIDIETDSTIAGDESQEKQDRTQFIESMTKFMEAWGPMVMQKPELAPLAGQLLLFGVRAFRVGRELEEVVEETVDKLAAPSATQKQPDPKVQAEQVKLQGAQMKVQGEMAKAQTDAQSGQQMAAAKLQQVIVEAQAKIKEIQMKMAEAEQEHGHALQRAQAEHGAAMDQVAVNQQKAQAAQMPKWPVDPGKMQGF